MGKKRRPTQTQTSGSGFDVKVPPERAELSHRQTQTGLEEQSRLATGRSKSDLMARAIRYLGLYLYIIVVYGGLLLTDYSIFRLVAWVIRDEIEKHHALALLFDYLNVGLALFIMLGALVHGLLSLVTLIKLDMALSRELENNTDAT